ncbi:hypothetical protein IP69_18145 [Bosea sp. AAP35]|uniref:DUF2283 domain-containing protein n=1 Tax=Bosea sp. AAP35 TaxID=1523417 RepID=UPI0006B92BC2|nr:DUF2283 domain-containing protein [Bosea sp. AAP35]KPF64600.1 hypothetical protein IP69_18145 [Bosea sp. AAP35]
MQVTYDPAVNAAYITLGKEPGELKTVQVSDEVLIDFDANGVIYGIELLDARRQLALENDLELTVEVAGRSLKLPLVVGD